MHVKVGLLDLCFIILLKNKRFKYFLGITVIDHLFKSTIFNFMMELVISISYARAGNEMMEQLHHKTPFGDLCAASFTRIMIIFNLFDFISGQLLLVLKHLDGCLEALLCSKLLGLFHQNDPIQEGTVNMRSNIFNNCRETR